MLSRGLPTSVTIPAPMTTPTTLPPPPSSDLLPAPPRPVTPRARRRAWLDPKVRFWWLAGLGLLAAAAYMAFAGWRAWSHQAWLSRSGTLVQAKVVRAGGHTYEGRGVPPDADVLLEFDWAGRPHQTTGRLANRKPGEFIFIGRTEPIRVNPADPNDWTAYTEPPRSSSGTFTSPSSRMSRDRVACATSKPRSMSSSRKPSCEPMRRVRTSSSTAAWRGSFTDRKDRGGDGPRLARSVRLTRARTRR